MSKLVEMRVDGRLTQASSAAYRAALLAAADAGEPFLALLDRRTMRGPTPDGRRATAELAARWGQIAPLVLAWADVYDEARAASLRRGLRTDRARPPYPYAVFTDLSTARAWLRGHQA